MKSVEVEVQSSDTIIRFNITLYHKAKSLHILSNNPSEHVNRILPFNKDPYKFLIRQYKI